MGAAILVGAIVATVLATQKAARAWGVGGAIGVGVVGGLGALFFPLLGLVACSVLFTVARNAEFKAIAAGVDDPASLPGETYGHADPGNPYSPPGHGGPPQGP